MKIKFKFSIEIRRQPVCARTHADEPPVELASVTEAHVERAPAWDFESSRSPAVAARFFGFGRPVTARSDDARGLS